MDPGPCVSEESVHQFIGYAIVEYFVYRLYMQLLSIQLIGYAIEEPVTFFLVLVSGQQ